jgi:MarR family 2-MHQ and catechol resistance regulon transcriptional repressor
MRDIPRLDALPHYQSWLLVGKTNIKCQHLLAARLADLDLSVAKYEVLHAIYRDEGLSQQRLARRLLVAKSNVTGLSQRLERDALIRREKDPEDGRGHCVFLTNRGRERVERAIEIQAGVIELMTGQLSRGDAQALDRIMNHVEGRLSAALSEASDPV